MTYPRTRYRPDKVDPAPWSYPADLRSFRGFLIANQNRDDSVGYIARKLLVDRCGGMRRGYDSFRQHIEMHHGPSLKAMTALDEAFSEYRMARTRAAFTLGINT